MNINELHYFIIEIINKILDLYDTFNKHFIYGKIYTKLNDYQNDDGIVAAAATETATVTTAFVYIVDVCALYERGFWLTVAPYYIFV